MPCSRISQFPRRPKAEEAEDFQAAAASQAAEWAAAAAAPGETKGRFFCFIFDKKQRDSMEQNIEPEIKHFFLNEREVILVIDNTTYLL